ncbi:MAG: Peptidase families and domain protein [Gemmatimonadetes bacterium]|nr:Peptidase families and domain protein [Gemmatimonadota bacterium]
MIGGIALGLVVLSGCGGSGGDASCDPIAATLVSRIEVQPPVASMADGGSLQLEARAFSCDGSQLALPAVTWSSADATTVSVSATGMAQGVKVGGPVAVTAAAQGKQGSAQLTVVSRAVASVTVEPATATVAAGRTSNLVVKAFDTQGRELAGRTAAWSSANTAIVTVSQQGAITGVTSGGPVQVTATIEGHSGSSQITVVDAAVASVTVSPSTSTIPAGTTVQLSAEPKDDQGNVLTGRAVLWTTSDPVRASVSNTGLVTGLAPGGPVTILATSEGRTGTAQVTVTPGLAAKLAFRRQPSSAVAGVAISPAVEVEVQDAAGGRVVGSTASVTVVLGANAGGGTLGGTRTVNAVDGIATFSTLTVNRSGEGYTLTAAATGLSGATSAPFSITAGPADRVAFLVQPSTTAAGAGISPAVQVEVRDALGNRVTASSASVTVALGSNPGSATLGGTLDVSAVNGVATFSGLTIDRAANGYSLVATSAGLSAATSAAFNVNPGDPAALAFVTQPSSVVAGASVSPAIQVEVLDALGNRVTGVSVPVALSLGNNPGGAMLGGTVSVNSVNGVAAFDALTLDRVGSGYTLVAGSPSLVGATSDPFDVTPGPASSLRFLVQPSDVTEGQRIAPAVQVQVLDALGNRVTNAPGPYLITMSVRSTDGGSPPGQTTLAGTVTSDGRTGVATFSNLVLSVSRDRTVALRATAGSLSVLSSAFSVNAR